MTGPACVFIDDPLPAGLTDPAAELGGKGLALRHLQAAGLRVPRGFTIGASVCRDFLSADDWPAGAWSRVESALDRLARQLAERSPDDIAAEATSPPDLRLAVRSGAAVSMPGLLQTLLDVPCTVSPPSADGDSAERHAAVRQAIEEVFRSWNSPAAERYRQRQAIDPQIVTAVTVQEMIDCIVSGVMFTRGACGATEELVIEAVAGSGESLVSGRQTPLRWSVRRQDRQIVARPEPDLSVPSGVEAALPELIATGLRLEEAFAAPLDIEWGLDRQGLVFFQTRPVAESTAKDQLRSIRDREIDRLKHSAAAGTRCWVRHNLSETLTHPTPLTWSLWRQFMSAGGGLGTLYRRLGYRPGRRLSGESFLTLIGGQIYADPDRAVVMFGEAWPWSYDIERLREDPAQLDQPPRHFDPTRLDPWFVWRLPALLWRTWLAQRRITQLMDTAADEFEQQTAPQLLAFVAGEQQTELADLDNAALVQRFERRRRQVLDEFAPRSLLPGTLGGIALAELTRQIARVLGPQVAAPLVREITPAGDLELVRVQQKLLAAWDQPAARTAFFEEFGHRAIGEMELALPRWRETPELIAGFAARHSARTPATRSGEHDVAQQRLQQAFTDAGAASLVSEARVWLDRCRRLLPYRDRSRHLWLKGYELLRQITEELSRRFNLGDRFYELTPAEWPDLIQGRDVQRRIDERRHAAAAFRRWHHPSFIDPGQLADLFTDVPPVDDALALRGTPLSDGYGVGRVWQEGVPAGPLAESCVLVCDTLQPSLVPLLAGTVAVVVQQGGTLSHAAILARQMGLPVVRLAAATRLLHEGQRVAVDGQTGQIELLDREES